MPNRIQTYLGGAFALSVVVYIGLVITTVYLASVQTDMQGSVSDTEASIGQLESKYYVAVNQISSLDPATLGFVTPAHTAFVRAAEAPALTLSDSH